MHSPAVQPHYALIPACLDDSAEASCHAEQGCSSAIGWTPDAAVLRHGQEAQLVAVSGWLSGEILPVQLGAVRCFSN